MQSRKVGNWEFYWKITKFLSGDWEFCWVLVGDKAGKLDLVKTISEFGLLAGNRESFKRT